VLLLSSLATASTFLKCLQLSTPWQSAHCSLVKKFVTLANQLQQSLLKLANKVKKILRDDRELEVDDCIALTDELGDVVWYAAATAERELGVPLSFVMRRTIEKLAARKAAGTLKGGDR
jgi:hypothetical protein